MSRTYRTIRLVGDGVQKEAVANAEILPGNLLEILSTGKVQKHSVAGCLTVAGRPVPLMVASENNLMGMGIGTGTLNGTFVTITKAYAALQPVLIVCPRPGDSVVMYLKAGQNVVVGSPLTSNGDGTLKLATASGETVIGRAGEACDLSASGAVNTLIQVDL